MDIDTNLGYTFSNFKNLFKYMQEENIQDVEVKTSYWGAVFPKEKLTLEEVEEIAKGENERN